MQIYEVSLMSRKVKIAVLIFVVLLTSAVVSFVSAVAVAGSSDKIFPGVSFKGTNLGNMTKDEARQSLADYADNFGTKTVNAVYKGGSGTFKLSDVEFKVNTTQIVDKAWQAGRQGNFLEQWQERRRMAQMGTEIPLEFSFSKTKMQVVLDKFTEKIRIPPKDAKLIVTPEETVMIAESSKGWGVDVEDSYKQLQEIIKQDREPSMKIKMVEIIPKETTNNIRKLKINGVLAKFTTRFNTAKRNRTYNIRVAAAALDGQVIKPGEVFSFNKIVGPRSQEAGYKTALIILNNEFVEDLGGGVCQVSSTLYNALLRADVQILQRSSHSLVITYVPLGQDAAVAYGVKDLKFKNNLPCAIIIKSSVVGNSLTFKLLGDTALRKTVSISNTIIKESPFKIVYKNDPTLPVGKQVVEQKGAKGYVVTSRIAVYQGGKLISKRFLSSSKYKPTDHLILVGTGGASAGPATVIKPGVTPGQPVPQTPMKPNSTEGTVTPPVTPNPTTPPPVTSPPVPIITPTTDPSFPPQDSQQPLDPAQPIQ